jgi:hypothetical protein
MLYTTRLEYLFSHVHVLRVSSMLAEKYRKICRKGISFESLQEPPGAGGCCRKQNRSVCSEHHGNETPK